MKYRLRNETAKDRYQRLSDIYKYHYQRTNGKEVQLTCDKGYVSINGDKMRLTKFEKALDVLKARPTVANQRTER